jgi:hypothetical protein
MSKKNKRQAPRAASAPAARGAEFNPDYSATRRELRRIGILAGIFIAILVVVAIFQNQILALFIK